jgi:hypothetical protein
MNNTLPESLPPVEYFMQDIGSGGWILFFRIFLVALALMTGVLYFCFRKRLPKEGKGKKKRISIK